MNNIDIFICTHKDFDDYPHSEAYKIVSGYELSKEYPYEIVYANDDVWFQYNKILNEFTYMTYIYENYYLKDYVGFVHYRRYFDFNDNVADMDEIFSQYDVIVGEPLIENKNFSISSYYGHCHSIDDLNAVDSIIEDLYGKEVLDKWFEFKSMNASEVFYPCNMFVMKRDSFRCYMEWMIPIVQTYLTKQGITCCQDAIEHVSANQEKYSKPWLNEVIQYQSRYPGFVIERLTAFYLWSQFKNPKQIKIIERK